MNIGETIRKYRKEKEMTQEHLAGLLGVTASAVNKWEKGSACPDIALLSPIARALGISLDTLLTYQESLRMEEVNALLEELKERMKKESYQAVFRWVQDKIHAFPNSEELIVQAAVVLNAYRIMGQVPDAESYDEQIRMWIERGLSSQEEEIRMMAAEALYTLYLNRQEYEKAETYLQYFSDQNPEKKYRQALIYGKRGQFEEAYKTYEELLYEERNRMSMTLNGIYVLNLQEEDFARAHYIADKIERLANCFEMGRYYEISHRLELAIQEQDKEQCITLAQEMTGCIRDICSFTRSPLYSHMKFREIDQNYGESMREALIRCFQDPETFGFLEEDERWKRLINAARS